MANKLLVIIQVNKDNIICRRSYNIILECFSMIKEEIQAKIPKKIIWF